MNNLTTFNIYILYTDRRYIEQHLQLISSWKKRYLETLRLHCRTYYFFLFQHLCLGRDGSVSSTVGPSAGVPTTSRKVWSSVIVSLACI